MAKDTLKVKVEHEHKEENSKKTSKPVTIATFGSTGVTKKDLTISIKKRVPKRER